MSPQRSLDDSRVAAVRLSEPAYAPVIPAEEMPDALGRLAALLGWADAERGPLGSLIPAGARVTVKPNWVLHENQGPWGIEPLLTHASLVRAVVSAVLRTSVGSVLVGDAPVQGCDFERLLALTGLDSWSAALERDDRRFLGIRDFRRTKAVFRNGVRQAAEDLIPLEQFVLFDLGKQSLLEPVSDGRASFRVTQYDPQQMARTHARGRHQYLITREVLDADVIINLPKLKTHKKAGVTCALKNLIGINGNKEYLPHHRVGGSGSGGDCYPGASGVKRSLEFAYDRLNQSASMLGRRSWSAATRLLHALAAAAGDRYGVEGSWSGNDTIWRTCLDLNRILLYGRVDGSLAPSPQRVVVHVVDAVIAGHGDGPLAPQPLPLGLLLGGSSGAAVDWVAARLLGYDPRRVPITREAFAAFDWPLASFEGEDVRLAGDLGSGSAESVLHPDVAGVPIIYPEGWLDAVAATGAGGPVGVASGAPTEG